MNGVEPRSSRGTSSKAAAPLLLALLCAVAVHSTAAGQNGGAPGGAPTTPTGPGLAVCPFDDLRRCLKRRPPPPALPPPPAPGEVSAPAAPPEPTETDAEAVEEDSSGVEAVVVTGERVEPSSSITNNQEAGVDEGGIVKNRGDILVILRRGRLFTVSTANGGLRRIDAVNAYPPGVRPDEYDDWYDEMLVAGDHVVVIGYSYDRGGTEINRFRMDAAGRLRFQDAYHLRSDDYYSSVNYASRLIGRRLIFYAPFGFDLETQSPEALPGLRRWEGSPRAPFKPIIRNRQVFIPPILRDSPGAEVDTLHTLTSCDLLAPTLQCSAIGALGSRARNFYVSAQAVYLWMSDPWRGYGAEREGAPAYVFRLPLQEGGRPSAVGVRGAPVDQFSFREDAADGVLNVLVRARGDGEAMWRAEISEGAVALLRLPLRSFSDGSREAPTALYRPLPSPPEDHYRFRNRFVGDHVVYGSGFSGEAEDGSDASGFLVAAPVRGGPARELKLTHTVDRLEVLGRDGLVVGSRGEDTIFTGVDLTPGVPPRIGDRYTLTRAAQSESRSHGFYFRNDAPDAGSGLLALPVVRSPPDPSGDPQDGADELDADGEAVLEEEMLEDEAVADETAAMVFVRWRERRFAALGELSAATTGFADDGCQVSCIDWYGDARPIFLRDRIFALLGYELVEGALTDTGIREVRRLDFAPAQGARRGDEER